MISAPVKPSQQGLQDKVSQFVNLLQQESQEQAQMFEGYGDLLTVQDLSQILGQSEQTIRRMCHDGELNTVRFGRRLYVPKQWFIKHVYDGGIKNAC